MRHGARSDKICVALCILVQEITNLHRKYSFFSKTFFSLKQEVTNLLMIMNFAFSRKSHFWVRPCRKETENVFLFLVGW